MSNVGTTYNSKLLVVYRYMHIARHKACLRESLIPTMAFVIGSEILCFFSKTYLEVIGSCCCCCVCAKTSESFYTVSRIFGSKQLAYSRIVPKNIPALTFIFRKYPKLKKRLHHTYLLPTFRTLRHFFCMSFYKKENKIEHYLVLY